MKLTPRPGYKELLAYCFDYYDVGFWTADGRAYANNVLRLILTAEQLSKIKFLKCGENCSKLSLIEMRCEFNNDFIVYKPLHRIWRTSWAKRRGWNCNNTLIIEDSPSTCIKNYGNAIYVPSFEVASGIPLEYFDITSKLIKYIYWFAINGWIE